MENNMQVIPIFYAVDDEYIPFLAVSLQSLIENASKKYFYSIKILYTHIEEENKKRIRKYESQNIKIEFVDLNYYIEEVKDKLYIRDYYSKSTYFRLFIPNLYPQYNKAIYLDSDTVVLGDISELFNEDIEGKLLAAVPDGIIQNFSVFQEYAELVVGVSNYKKYFNAGVLLMNLDEMRRFDFQSKFLYLLETIKFKVAQDQDYLNRLCKGKTKIIHGGWYKMPIIDDIPEDELKILHFNINYKPWHFDNVLYKDYFWNYAKKTEFYNDILTIKKNYTEEERFRDMEQFKNLKELAKMETGCVGDDRAQAKVDMIEKAEYRIKVYEKIKILEEEGKFDVDAEEDPPTIPLLPEDVDYLNKKSTNKIKNKIAYKMGERFLNDLIRDKKLIIKQVNGIENLSSIETGAIVTCNHFNPYDSFTVEKVFRMSGLDKTKKLYKVIREGNYTNFPGLYGFFFRHCNTLPLSSNSRTMVEFMKAVDKILQRNDFILIYPEQSMWWNYRKPKPLKVGAFKFAARNHVPVIPIFITMEDSEIIGEDGFPVQEYTVNVLEPIYPNDKLKEKENAHILMDMNYKVWKQTYEDFYKMPLEYTTIEKNIEEEVG